MRNLPTRPRVRSPMRHSLAVLVVALAAGAAAAPAPAAPKAADALAVAGRLARALDRDAPLAGIADPVGGIRVWYEPASEPVQAGTLVGRGAPSRQLAKMFERPNLRASYAHDVAAGVRYALAHVELDPRDPDAARFQVDCMNPKDVHPPKALFAHGALVRRGAVEVRFVVRGARVYVSDVFVYDACMV
jgi:hypothetical protein